jgi:hypothetical protein
MEVVQLEIYYCYSMAFHLAAWAWRGQAPPPTPALTRGWVIRNHFSKATLPNIETEQVCWILGPSVSFGVRSRKLSNVGQSLDGWPKIYYLELRASESTLSQSRLHLQSLAPTPVSRRFDVRQADGRKNKCLILSQHDENILYRPHLVGFG